MMSDETIDWEKLSITGNPNPGVYKDIMQVRTIDNTLIHPKKLTIEGPNIFVHYHTFEGETHKRSAILKLSNENSLYQILDVLQKSEV